MTPRRIANLKKCLFQSALRRVFMKPCPNVIPGIDDKAKSRNCFAAFVNTDDGKPYLLLDSLDGDLIKCHRWDSHAFSEATEERVHNLVDSELSIFHYYGLDTIEFRGAWNFFWHRYTAFDYIRIGARQAWQASSQFLFNTRSLPSQRRLKILRLLVSSRLSGNTEGLTSWDVMTELYSMRWFKHPASETRSSEVEFQLESFLDSGELKKSGSSYEATPKSLVILDQVDEQDRRHREAFRLQACLVILTFILALAAIIQTGLVKLSTAFVFGSE